MRRKEDLEYARHGGDGKVTALAQAGAGSRRTAKFSVASGRKID